MLARRIVIAQMTEMSMMQSHAGQPPIAILGVPFDNLTTGETVELIGRMVQSRRPHYLVTANVDFLVQAQQDLELRRILFDAHVVLCDGTLLLWASRWLGNPLPGRVTGSDLVPLLLRVAAEKQYRVFLLGATPESAAQAIADLKTKHPDLALVGHYSPPFNQLLEMDHAEIARRIVEARPDLLFVSFGCPKQEKWIAMHYRALGVPVSVGVGATIDFLAGQVRRAPRWMQRSGTEWVFRLGQAPRRRFARSAKGLWVFSRGIVGQWWRLQFRAPKLRAQVSTPVQTGETWQCVKLPARFDLQAARNDALLVDQVLADGRDCLLDLSAVEFIDSTGVGMLIRLQKKIRASGQQLVLLAPSVNVQRALKLMHLQNFFAAAPDLTAARELIAARRREECVPARPRTAAALNPLVWQGEVTAANAGQVWARTEAHVLALTAARRDVVIDLAAVRFLDSTGAGLMLRARKLAQREGFQLTFAHPTPAVLNVLRFAGLEEFLLGEGSRQNEE
jgi:N-acetylglucosaminyldiphosphoundecaprenol N-acetyl-beta-D-mannosaminyltransferase